MKSNITRSCALLLSIAMIAGTLLTGCGSNPAASTPSESNPPASAQAVSLPDAQWLAEVTFPDWTGQIDDSLGMNSMYSFSSYSGQGTLYITPAEGVTGFTLFVNNHSIDTSTMTAGQTWAVDISQYTVNGLNSIQLGNIQPATISEAVTVRIPYPTVVDGTPQEVGISPDVLEAIGSIVESDIENGFTSAQIAVIKDGRLIYQNAWGTVNAYNPDGSPKTDSAPVTNDTLYDLASNTKMYSVNYALQYLVSQDLVSLDSRICDILGQEFVTETISIPFADYEAVDLDTVMEWKSALTIRDVLRHQAGFPADPQYHNDAFDQTTQKPDAQTRNILYSGHDGTAQTRQATLNAIFQTPLMYEPGTKTVYSDVDYMLLSFVIEKITGQEFSSFLRETFWDPMELDHITYLPLENGFTSADCAATELNGNTRDGAISFTGVRSNTLQGQVHDEKCHYAMGGISGHAGLFANATDLAKLASVMLTGGYGTHKFFDLDVLDTFTAPKKEDVPHWGLGWWREADMRREWYFGTQSSRDTIGHQGWTGTLTMIDPAEHLVVVYLTNKINSPVTDPAENPNKFNGNWYTSSTLGFVAQLLYQGIDDRAVSSPDAISALLSEMARDKFKLVDAAEGVDASHPLVRSGYAMAQVLFDRASATGSDTDWQYAKDIMQLMDPVRDADALRTMEQRLKDAGKS